MSEDDLTLPNDVGDSGSIKVSQPVPDNTSPYGYRYRSIEVFPAKIVEDLRSELAFAKHAADYWKKRADEPDERCAKTLETLRALFEKTPDDMDFFYDIASQGKHWCKACGESANAYVRVTHADDCLVGAAEAVIDKAEGS